MPECLEANENAITRRKEQKLLEARSQLQICAAASCPAEVREECTRRTSELSAAIPSLVLIAKNGAGEEVKDVVVTMDGRPFATQLDGTAKDVDPGEHVFVFEATGAPKVEQKITVKEGEKGRRETVVVATAGRAGAANSSSPFGELGPLRIAGLATAGLGVIGLGLGTVFGIVALGKNGDAGCDGTTCPSADAAATLQDAKDAGGLSTIFLIGGGALVGAGAALFFLAPSGEKKPAPSGPPPTTARLGFGPIRGGAGVSYGGTW